MRGRLQIGADGPCFTLPDRGSIVIGRAAECDLTIDDKLVSRRHCRIEADGEFFWVEDLDSKAGTLLNDAPVKKALLYDGDELLLGGTRLTFSRGDADSPLGPPSAPGDPGPEEEPLASPGQLVGQTIGGCEIIRLLHEAGDRRVFEARQVSMDRRVAVKILAPAGDASEDALDAFLRSARVAGRLCHTHIVSVFDAGRERGLAYAVMEYVDQASLRDVLNYRRKKRQPLPLYTTLTFAIHICRGLDHAHKRGVVHGRVRPSHVLIDRDNEAKLTSFAAGDSAAAADPREEAGYAAPERLEGDAPAPAGDIYSLGAVLYHMAANRPPQRFNSPEEADEASGVEPLAWPEDADPPIPEAVRAICEKAMRRDPEERFADARELRDALYAARKRIRADAQDGE